MADEGEEPLPNGSHWDKQLHQKLESLKGLYQETHNPLCVWEAIYNSLVADEPFIPKWCIPYLGKSSLRLMRLASGRDFVQGRRFMSRIARGSKTIGEQAMKLVPEALELSRQGKRNAFDALYIDREDIQHARKAERNKLSRVLTEKLIETTRNVQPARAQRLLARGKRLKKAMTKPPLDV